jgi:hypothetical protein
MKKLMAINANMKGLNTRESYLAILVRELIACNEIKLISTERYDDYSTTEDLRATYYNWFEINQ